LWSGGDRTLALGLIVVMLGAVLSTTVTVKLQMARLKFLSEVTRDRGHTDWERHS